MNTAIKIYTFLLLSVFLLSCSDEPEIPDSRGVYMLLDTSGTYTKELKQAQRVINYVLSELNPGDSFAVARVDTGSFGDKNIVAKVTFHDRPSAANQQKRAFREKIDQFIQKVKGSAYTDITSGILQAVEYLTETGTGHNTILIFSDLKEDLRKGYKRNIPLQVKNYSVVALNVTKLRSDKIDPREYLARLETWRAKVESAGGEWRIINDMTQLEDILKNE